MTTPQELRALADDKKKMEGDIFASSMIKEIEIEMIEKANAGNYELKIQANSGLNRDNWLTEPHLYNALISKLKNSGFEISHSDDMRDGTYMIIKW
ncbi:hypothetical protein AT268_31700 [Bacillus cereus]|uniref:Uncharacterized protein n=1 Tax=Bacillus cereus TaxID=1396 RepID=A0A9X0MJW7_BACCE|nr:hypothetical protein [Bacillus cereus]KXY51069.1 hypothetical protein AT268_31700 [Bacillus cereus]PEZ75228.1 hypothetical protein CN410_14205 [Bacillus anthracis]